METLCLLGVPAGVPVDQSDQSTYSSAMGLNERNGVDEKKNVINKSSEAKDGN